MKKILMRDFYEVYGVILAVRIPVIDTIECDKGQPR